MLRPEQETAEASPLRPSEGVASWDCLDSRTGAHTGWYLAGCTDWPLNKADSGKVVLLPWQFSSSPIWPGRKPQLCVNLSGTPLIHLLISLFNKETAGLRLQSFRKELCLASDRHFPLTFSNF